MGKRAGSIVLLLILAGLVPGQPESAPRTITVTDAAGKDTMLKKWRFTLGTRPLSRPAADPRQKNKKAPAVAAPGPEYLELREDNSTLYANGILTLVPVTALRQLEYDNDKKIVTARVQGPGGKDVVLTGPTKFVGLNKVAIEGEADLGKLGVGLVKFRSGDKEGVKSFRFSSPVAVEPVPAGRSATILAQDKEKSPHLVTGLTALYQAGSGTATAPLLTFLPAVKIDLSKLKKLRALVPEDKKKAVLTFEVVLEDGASHNLTLADSVKLADDQPPAKLIGLIGRVDTGYQLYPAHTIAELTFGNGKEKEAAGK